MKELFYGASGRFIRVAIAVIIAGIITQYGDNPMFMVIAPMITAFSKWLRDNHGIDIKVL